MITSKDTFIEKDGVWQEAGGNNEQWAQGSEVKREDTDRVWQEAGSDNGLWAQGSEVKSEDTDEKPFVAPSDGYDVIFTDDIYREMKDHEWIQEGGIEPGQKERNDTDFVFEKNEQDQDQDPGTTTQELVYRHKNLLMWGLLAAAVILISKR